MATEFDHEQLDAITGGDKEFEREVLEEYLNSAPADLEKVRAAIAAGDAPVTGASAHALKGASATIGAKGFAAIALEIEQAGKRGDLASIAPVFARLQAEFAALRQLLRSRIDRAA